MQSLQLTPDKGHLKSVLKGGLASSRVRLRLPMREDGPLLFEAVRESIAELRRFSASLPWSVDDPSVDASTEFCVRGAEAGEALQDFPFLVFDTADGRLIGSVGIHRFDWMTRNFELGFWCRSSMVGRGYMTEAAKLATEFCFNTCRAARVFALPDCENKRSIALLQRLGFKEVEIVCNERQEPRTGKWRNSVLYERRAI